MVNKKIQTILINRIKPNKILEIKSSLLILIIIISSISNSRLSSLISYCLNITISKTYRMNKILLFIKFKNIILKLIHRIIPNLIKLILLIKIIEINLFKNIWKIILLISMEVINKILKYWIINSMKLKMNFYCQTFF